jgi:hypothetical protein
MGAEAHHFETIRVWFSVNQHKIGADVAIPMIVPLAD